jgi:predicted nucleic acid-binding protein
VNLFVDTSACLALLDKADENHAGAGHLWRQALEEDWTLVTSNYVAVEGMAVAQHRFGLDAARSLAEDLLPVVEVHWVDAALQASAMAAVLTARRRQLSLVDCTSFLIVRQLGLDAVFTFDSHFAEQGFSCLPKGSAAPVAAPPLGGS